MISSRYPHVALCFCPFSGAPTPCGASLAPSARALPGLPFRIGSWFIGNISPTVLEHFCSLQNILCDTGRLGLHRYFRGYGHTLDLWWNSGCHRTVPHAGQSQCFLRSLLCRIQPCSANGHKPWPLAQVFLGGRQQLLLLLCPPFKHWKLGCVAIYSWSHGDKQMATLPEWYRWETSQAKSRMEGLWNKQRINPKKPRKRIKRKHL